MLVAGLVPLLIFWVEHRVTQKVRAENPELGLGGVTRRMTTAFVLGGGGVLGAVEVGMLRALFERDITPDLVLGTSIGALNGAMVARDPDAVGDRQAHRAVAAAPAPAAPRCTATARCAPSAGPCRPAPTCGRPTPLKQALVDEFGDLTFEELPVRFQVCAASIERAAEHWFDSGPVVDAVVASAAVPGLLPPAKVGDEHYLDGGIVNSIPLGRAVQLGAVAGLRAPGRPDRPAADACRSGRGRSRGSPSRSPGGTGSTASSPSCPRASRRTSCPRAARRARTTSLLGSRDFSGVQERIDVTYEATVAYLDEHLGPVQRATVIWVLRRLRDRAARGRRWPCCSGSPCRCG